MKIRKLLTLVAVTMVFTACNNDQHSMNPAVDKLADTPVKVKASVSHLETRLGHAAGNLMNGSMGLYFTTCGDELDIRYNASNREVRYEANAGWSILGTPLLWKGSHNDVKYYAYHPYQSDITADNKITVTASVDQNVGDVTDFLYTRSSTNVEVSPDGIDIKFKHQMAKLIVNLVVGGDELDANTTFKSVVLGDVFNESQFDLATETWDNPTTESQTNITMQACADGKSFEAILIPQGVLGFTATITLGDGRKYAFTRGEFVLSPGVAHTLNLLVGRDKVMVANVTATDWNKDSENDNIIETE